MRKSLILSFFFLFFIYSIDCSAKGNAYVNLFGGLSYWNSNGLNRITEGFDSGYGTSFGDIKVPYKFGLELGVRSGDVSLGFIYGFDYSSKKSLSSVYNYTQSIKLGAMPFGLVGRYFLYSDNRVAVSTGMVIEAYRVSLSTSSTPNPLNEGAIVMKAWGWSASANVVLDYEIKSRFFLSPSIGFRYAKTARLKYTTDTGGHNNGDYVLFNDGTNLTLNLSGLNFLLGLKFYFGDI